MYTIYNVTMLRSLMSLMNMSSDDDDRVAVMITWLRWSCDHDEFNDEKLNEILGRFQMVHLVIYNSHLDAFCRANTPVWSHRTTTVVYNKSYRVDRTSLIILTITSNGNAKKKRTAIGVFVPLSEFRLSLMCGHFDGDFCFNNGRYIHCLIIRTPTSIHSGFDLTIYLLSTFVEFDWWG
jgi:hypothetical protein